MGPRVAGREVVANVTDLIFMGIPFVFLGLCLLYVRAAARLEG
jgi:hypothetical protein